MLVAKCGDVMQSSDLPCASCTMQCNPFCIEEKREFYAHVKVYPNVYKYCLHWVYDNFAAYIDYTENEFEKKYSS